MGMAPQQQSSPPSRFWRWALVAGIGALVVGIVFAAGVFTGRDLLRSHPSEGTVTRVGSLDTDASTDSDAFPRLDEVVRLIQDEYYDWPSDPQAQTVRLDELESRAIQGVMGGLDGFSTYLVPAAQRADSNQITGEYEGIGIWVAAAHGVLTIIAPMPGSPAEAAGLLAGDVVEAADGRSLQGVTVPDALSLISGPAGTTVRLTIRRPGTADLLTIDVVRQHISVPAVIYAKLPETNVAHIQVTIFGDKTTAQLDDALSRAQSDGVAGIVLDLRNNGGGWVESAQEMIGRFVPVDAGAAYYEADEPNDPDLTAEPIIGGGQQVFDLPLIVLVNGGTASASEIVAGALRDYGRAQLIGETTYGKGSVQRVHEFADGSSVGVTFAHWLTPHKLQLQDQGLQPDIEVAAGENPDPQLQRAVAELVP